MPPPRRPPHVAAACLTVLLALLIAVAAPLPAFTAETKEINAAIARGRSTTAGSGHQHQRGHSIRARCAHTKGHWCSRFFLEPLVPLSPTVPAFNKTCPDPDCNGVGVCNARTGLCDCPAGKQREREGQIV
jgi:hypothetical protein